MEDLCSNYREVYQRAYRKLTVALPVDKLTSDTEALFSKADEGGTADKQERSRDTLLESIKEDLKAGHVTSFEQLLEAMAAYVDSENDTVVDRILKTMKKEIEGTICSYTNNIHCI